MNDTTWYIVYHRPKNKKLADKVGNEAIKALSPTDAVNRAHARYPHYRKNRLFAKPLSQDQVEQGTANLLKMTQPQPEIKVDIPEIST